MPAQNRFEWLDCLRGYAIAGVVLTHLHLFPAGGRGVQLFFVASAISLMYAHAAHGEEGARAFFVRRVFRIMPMLWLAVLLFYIVDWITTGHTADKWQIVSAVTLLPSNASYAFQNVAVPGSWSIVCEASFYILFPIAVAFVTTSRRAAILLLASIAIAAACLPMLIRIGLSTGAETVSLAHNFAFLSAPTQLPCFAIGLLAYALIREQRPFAKAAGWLGVFCVVALSLWGGDGVRFYLVWITTFGLVAFALANGQLGFLVNRPARWLGLISYSVYYWHILIIAFLSWALPLANVVVTALCVWALTLPLATFTYLTVERPMMRAGARVASRFGRKATRSMSESVPVTSTG
jgi:exopolysaccharide production protein ExoZ